MRLILIRHGQTPANVLGLLDTAHPGPGLTELGERQAAAIPAALRGESIDAIFVSTLVRTTITATPLANELGLAATVLGGIHEIEAGDLEGLTGKDAVRAYLEAAFAWGLGDRDARMPGEGTGHDFFGRFDADIAEVLDSGAETAVVVSHGAAIRVWVAGTAVDLDPSFAAEHDLMNTGMVTLEGSFDDGWRLIDWNGTPAGGVGQIDEQAPDPTGETLAEAREA
jgi:broad specificity phosphatase PhoE